MNYSNNPGDIPAAILAGGLGTRLSPLTVGCPKVMVEVGGKPFIHYLLEMLYRRQIRHIVLCIGHLGEQVRSYVGDGAWLGLQVEYSYDCPESTLNLLGTAGAIRNALPRLGNNFWVINGDTFLDVDYSAIYRYYQSSKQANLMVVYKNENHWWPSNVALGNGLVNIYSKSTHTSQMHYIDTGVAILQADTFKTDNNVAYLSLLYEQLTVHQQLAAYEVRKRFYEINTINSLRQTTRFLLKGP